MVNERSCYMPRLTIRKVVPIYFTMVAAFLTVLLVSLHGTSPVESSFPYKVPLDPKGMMELYWNVSYPEKVVYFQILIKDLKAGMIFGMSDRGDFEDADLAILWSNGFSSFFGDAWSDQEGRIHIDSQQDYQLLMAQQAPEGLYIVFKRAFSTCDPHDYLIEDGTVHLIYAVLEKPLHSITAINVSAIQNRGLQRVQLLKPERQRLPPLPADVRNLQVLAPNVLIPDQETTYWCYITELPQNFPKHHILMYEPVVTKGHEAIVHHMEVFQCSSDDETIPHFSGPCDAKMKPEKLNHCRHVLAAWAMGAKPFYYPEDVGLAFGGPGSSRFLRLEVHYHNPLQLKGLRDSSGIRLHYTPSLRKFDAGIMELGLVYTPLMAIPPLQKQFVLSGYCTDKCTNKALPPDGIRVFGSQLHTHLTGRAVSTMLVREGREVEVLNEDKHFSPHFQEIRMLKKMVHVLPTSGARLQLEPIIMLIWLPFNGAGGGCRKCGGFSITDEMCVNYIHYYPRTELEVCKSHVDPGFLSKYFHLINRFNSDDVCTCPQVSVTEQYREVPWNPFSVDVLNSLYGFAPISEHCNKSSAMRFPGEWEMQPVPQVTKKLRSVTPSCESQKHSGSTGPELVNIKNQDQS
ncbi:dopamine beta-hydroxylase [Pelobates cultripes]|uniref:Dopamine beta-hydroxylase n=1 Tax=Pelobates cultripes TaxID=61616 RepID=A0AAD1T1Z6_PELCU|nr:dopamine beta-hydroxylase [Pelobates cultripes]